MANNIDHRFLSDEHILYIENEHIRLGINLALGGAVTYLAEHGKPNLINSSDWGRQVQMSFYGYPVPFLPEGVDVADHWKDLGWNPIGCGDFYGNRSRILESRSDCGEIYVRCRPMQWPLNNVPGDCTFECRYRLNGTQVEVTARLNNERADTTQYPARGQELPAVYTNGVWWKAVSYNGNAPYTDDAVVQLYKKDDPCWPDSIFFATEHWCALVDDSGYGLGIWMPSTTSFSTGCFGTPGVGGPQDSPTGYMGPTQSEILDHNIVYTYQYALIVGTVEHIRAVAVAREKARTDLYSWHFDGSRDHFWYKGFTDAGVPEKNGCLDFTFVKDGALVAPPQHIPASKTRLILDAAIEGDVPVKVHRQVYTGAFRLASQGGLSKEEAVTVTAGGRLTGDGTRREYELSLGLPINSIGFEVEFGGEGHARIWGVRVE